MSTKIPILVSHQKAFVWDVQDAEKLRSDHRICGLLTGTLPHLSQQNVFLGVPLNLMPEEVVLLVGCQIAVLIDDISAHHVPTQEQLQNWSRHRSREREEDIVRQNRLKEGAASEKNTSRIAQQKRMERETKKASSAPQKDNSNIPPSSIATAPSSYVYTTSIPTSSSKFPWFSHNSHTYETLEAARDAGIWNYPSSLEERARCGVFRALWEKGYFLGSGVKFGGEYLVYPGDPLRYHSHFVATVHTEPSGPLRPMEIVAHGRLGTATKKAHIMGSWDDTAKTVELYSIEWAGFG